MGDASDAEVVFEVGAEGGSMTLYRSGGVDGPERFFVERNEVALYEHVATFVEGLALMDEHGWFRLAPRNVNVRFAARLLEAVEARLRADGADDAAIARALHRWRRVSEL